MKSLLNSRKKDPEGLRKWYRDTCLNGHGGAFDPYKWNMNEVNLGLVSIKADDSVPWYYVNEARNSAS